MESVYVLDVHFSVGCSGGRDRLELESDQASHLLDVLSYVSAAISKYFMIFSNVFKHDNIVS